MGLLLAQVPVDPTSGWHMMSLEQAATIFILMLVAQIPLLVAAIVTYIRTKAANLLAKNASDKADQSHKVVGEIKELAVKTENQTNNRLSMLDAKVAAHEIRCVRNQKESAEQQRQIAELKLALAEERAKRGE